MLSPVLVTPPAAAISVDDAKAHLRVDHDDDNVLIEGFVAAAQSHLEGWTGILGRALEVQTWEVALDQFPADGFVLPVGPVVSVTEIVYDDAAGIEQTVPGDDYQTVSGRVFLAPSASWPAAAGGIGGVRIRWTAGTGTPPAIRSAMLLFVGHLYANREAVGPAMEALPLAFEALVTPWRRVGL